MNCLPKTAWPPTFEESKIEMLLRQSRDPVSLDMPVGADEEAPLGDFIEDSEATDAESAVVASMRHSDIRAVLNTLEPREQDVIPSRIVAMSFCEPRS